ncbi:MAG: [protein-PII] uridylyltransferase, partial [Gammaproteobacteria bacterium]|nr:[protein-PII] uridylyltransferase [Gammaproteobacteria bacterium]
ALIAVGGYGRGELHPHSDVDILILIHDDSHETIANPLEAFITLLWDIGLEIGHSARTIDDCQSEARQDITVTTNLMETRLLQGEPSFFDAMRDAVGPDNIWPSGDFFKAKWQEQKRRHLKYHDTAYNLEPNIKEGPGGLRDIQMLSWVSLRQYGEHDWHDLVQHNFLTEDEFNSLVRGRDFLWQVRFALHIATGRHEDRLLFDYQRTLAQQFNFQDETPQPQESSSEAWSRAADGHRLGVELFMKKYYRAIMELRRLNEMLLQLFQQAILYPGQDDEPIKINRRFQIRKGYLEVTRKETFEHYPFAILEVFLIMTQDPNIRGVSAETIRLIRTYRHLIDDGFRDDIRCKTLFMEILRQPKGITRELRRMNDYGVLAAYIPSFAKIVGLMQYDLYHVYTVDQHTLFVIRNLRRFNVEKFSHEFPLCSLISKHIPKPELLLLAGLFHDIAKGRGGDHSTLGGKEAIEFCKHHCLSQYDTNLVSWLVENHLLMSATAQHQDTSDPEVINTFASKVADKTRLDYLYLLTVADMRGTNPVIWNNWKDALLIELYKQTQRAFEQGLENPLDKHERILETKSSVKRSLQTQNIDPNQFESLWENLDEDYFLKYSIEDIMWHCKTILRYENRDSVVPLIALKNRDDGGSTDIFIHTQARHHLFAIITDTLDRLGLNIVEAKIISSESGITMDSYSVLEYNGDAIRDIQRKAEIKEQLGSRIILDEINEPQEVSRPQRKLKHFTIDTSVSFAVDELNNHTIMVVATTDRPGLLSRIAYILMKEDVLLKNAKISTFGAEVEDIFFITDHDGLHVSSTTKLKRLKQILKQKLDEPYKEEL